MIVYARDRSGMESEIAELIQRGLVEKRKVEGDSILLLGTWEMIERRFTNESAKVSTLFTADMTETLGRYSEGQTRVIEQTFASFGSLRKGGQVSPGILLRQLQAYERYPVSAVIDGLRAYLEGGHAEQGKGEQYALGIVRGFAKTAELRPPEEKGVPEVPATDSVTQERRQVRTDARTRRDEMILTRAREVFGRIPLEGLHPMELRGVIQWVDDQLGVESPCGSS